MRASWSSASSDSRHASSGCFRLPRPWRGLRGRPPAGEWLAERRTWPGADTPALFLNRRGGRLSTRAVAHLVDEFAKDADLVNGAGKSAIYAYSIRHTYGHQPESERSCISCIIRQFA